MGHERRRTARHHRAPQVPVVSHNLGLISTSDAAATLGVSVRTVHRLVHLGHLRPACKLDRGHLFHAADVNAFAAACQVQP